LERSRAEGAREVSVDPSPEKTFTEGYEDAGGTVASQSCYGGQGICTSSSSCPADHSPLTDQNKNDCKPNLEGGRQLCCIALSENDALSSDDDGAGGPTGSAQCDPAKFTKVAGTCLPKETGLSEAPIGMIVLNLIKWMIGIVGFLAILAFLVSGAQYLLGFADEDLTDTAKTNMKWSMVGIAVALGAFIIVRAIASALFATQPFF
jgi:hypothetical protein